MAVWNIDTFDSVADSLRSKFPAPYVEGVPQGVVRDGPQDNPFATASILGTYTTGNSADGTISNNKYMHYCTRMLRWNDIDLTNIANIGNRSSCHKTSRFGDLGDMLGKGNDGDQGKANKTNISGFGYNVNDEMTRYRFNPITRVKYYQYTSRGMRYSEIINNHTQIGFGSDLSGSSVGNHPFAGLTCGWSPGSEDSSFHWNPNSTELTQISTDIAADLATKGTTLAKLQALNYTWNLCVIAWCWAGYRRSPYQGARPTSGLGQQRDVSEVDIYYFPFIF
jgi:hypothetical protein